MDNQLLQEVSGEKTFLFPLNSLYAFVENQLIIYVDFMMDYSVSFIFTSLCQNLTVLIAVAL